jgi:hypothetical protein
MDALIATRWDQWMDSWSATWLGEWMDRLVEALENLFRVRILPPSRKVTMEDEKS